MNGVRSVRSVSCTYTLHVRAFSHSRSHLSIETSGSPSESSFVSGPWDTFNRIRVLASAVGIVGFGALMFDTVYRRASKQELQDVKKEVLNEIDARSDKLDAKIEKMGRNVDTKIDGLNSKIDGLIQALLHTQQRDKISTEAENRELRREIEALKKIKD
jgi:hypothetical protein